MWSIARVRACVKSNVASYFADRAKKHFCDLFPVHFAVLKIITEEKILDELFLLLYIIYFVSIKSERIFMRKFTNRNKAKINYSKAK